MSTANRQTWDEANFRKLWIAFFNTHPGALINTEELAAKMGASKRALDDQFKILRREARAFETPTSTSSAQHDSDSVEESDLNVYQRAKKGLPPLGTRQKRKAPGVVKGRDAVEKMAKRPAVSRPAHQHTCEAVDDDDDDIGGDDGNDAEDDLGGVEGQDGGRAATEPSERRV